MNSLNEKMEEQMELLAKLQKGVRVRERFGLSFDAKVKIRTYKPAGVKPPVNGSVEGLVTMIYEDDVLVLEMPTSEYREIFS